MVSTNGREDEVALLATARRQHGVFSRAQALACGFSDDRISSRLRSGVWLRVYPGVYRVAGVPDTVEGRAMAAVLACGKGALASHGTAGVLYELELPRGPVEVTIPRARSAGPSGVVVHRPRALGRGERAMRGPIPCTTPARTLVDLAGSVHPDLLEDTLDDVLRRFVPVERLLAYLADPSVARRKGVALLRDLAEDRHAHGVPRSGGESLLDRVMRQANLPRPVREVPVRVGGRLFKLDRAYPEEKVALEMDGFLWHEGRRQRFEDDKERRRLLEVTCGWLVVELTWRGVKQRPADTCVAVAEALGLRPVRWVKNGRRHRHH